MSPDDLSPMLGAPAMTDAWLMKAATAAAATARSRFPEEHQEAALLRGLAHSILLAFGTKTEAALRIPFTGGAQPAQQEVLPADQRRTRNHGKA